MSPTPYEHLVFRGPRSPVVPTHLVEVPHGATRTAEYESCRAALRDPGPSELVDFFHVNTDAGAPELASAVARRVVGANPAAHVVVLRATLPRTFIDVNRVLDADPAAFRAGKVTPGVPPWIQDPADRDLLRERHARYVAEATRLVDQVEGRALLLHTYAPRSVDVEVDLDIAAALRRAWSPEVAPTWPERPAIDLIGRDVDGQRRVSPERWQRLASAFAALGFTMGDSETYPLHPSTQAWHHDQRWPGRMFCVEIRRDLVCRWDPFVQMEVDSHACETLAGPLAAELDAGNHNA